MLLNPALTGNYIGDCRFINSYRNQWYTISENAYSTFSSSLEFPIYQKYVSGGINLYNDQSGDSKMTTTQFNFSIASKIDLDDRNELSIGIQPGWTQHKANHELSWDAQYNGKTFDQNLPSKELTIPNSINYFDISSGLFWKSSATDNLKFKSGIAISHLNRANQSLINFKDRLFVKYTAHFETEIKLGSYHRTTYIPSFAIWKQGATLQTNIGFQIKQSYGLDSKYTGVNSSSFSLIGFFYRVNDAAIIYLAYEHKKSYSVGISYDLNISRLNLASNYHGGIELSLSYKFYKPKKILNLYQNNKKIN